MGNQLQHPGEKSPSGSNRGEILLVDDSPSALTFLSSALSEAGYQVREATSGFLALKTLQYRQPELVLLDVRMPEMDGFEVCRRIKADPATREIAVIFLSAQDETEDKIQGLNAGAVDFILKTFPQGEVFARLDTHIALFRAKRALEAARNNLETRVSERTLALQKSQALLQTVIDSSPDWIYAIDSDSRFLLVNRNMSLALGHADSAELIGRHDWEVIHPHASDAPGGQPGNEMRKPLLRVLAGETVYYPQESITFSDGRLMQCETYSTPMRNSDGSPYGVLCYRRDISQRLLHEEEKRELQAKLWQAKKMEAIGQLAGGIAHDFNNLLSLILGFASFAQQAMANNKYEKINDYIAEIVKAGSSGQEVVAQLLAFSRTSESAAQAIDPGQVIDDVIATLSISLPTTIDLTVDIDRDLPQVSIKPSQLHQIITNLVLNARDALDGSGNIEIGCKVETIAGLVCTSCHASFNGKYVTLFVRDSGRGIPENILEKIFEPFFTTKDVGKGSGLGLAMVHGIAHSASGHIMVSSIPDEMTVFRIFLPVS